MLTSDQIEELQKIVEDNHSIFILNTLGSSFLSQTDKNRLLSIGIDLNLLNNDSFIRQSFFLGIISDTIKSFENRSFSFKDLKTHIQKGQYIPLSISEESEIQFIEQQSLKDIKGLRGKIFSDINQVLIDSSRQSQEDLIRGTVKQGLLNKESVNSISRDLSSKIGDWSRDFDRIVQFSTQSAYETGKSVSIKRFSDKEDPDVYKVVYSEACRHCIRLYLTEGIGSQPRIFKLSELQNNGTNIGRKVDDWKPVVGPVHPYCFTNRKTPIYTSKGYKYIKDIKVGDLVLTHKKRFRRVTDLIFTERQVDYTLNIYCEIQHKNSIREVCLKDITPEHPVFVNNNWVSASNIKVGQKLSLLHDNCLYDNCKNNYPLYYKDSVDRQRYFFPDIYIPELNIVLEADGENWHDTKKDKLRDLEIKESCGADVFRFTEFDLRNNLTKVFEELTRILKNHKREYSLHHIKVTRIEKKELSNSIRKLYNFSVEEDESYIVNGFVVHNCRCSLMELRRGEKWNDDKKQFIFSSEELKKQSTRKRVKIQVGSKTFFG